MSYGFHLSTAGAITGMRRLDTVANNLANSTTVGFKADMLALTARKPENLEHAGLYADTNASLDALGGGSLFHPSAIDLRQGSLRETKNPLDIAIHGDGFLMLETPKSKGARGAKPSNDVLLTRAGSLTRDPNGRLVTTATGAPLLDTNGKTITLDPTDANVRIDGNGRVFQGEDEVARLALVVPQNLDNLHKEGRDAMRLVGGKFKPAPDTTEIRAGALEESTVDAVATLAELVRVSRGIEFSTRLMQFQDQMTSRLVDTFGRFG
jgi:flagellar basal body rod protein FlgG